MDQLELLNAGEIVPWKTADCTLFQAIHSKTPDPLRRRVCVFISASVIDGTLDKRLSTFFCSDEAHFWTLLMAAVHLPRSRKHSANCTLFFGMVRQIKDAIMAL